MNWKVPLDDNNLLVLLCLFSSVEHKTSKTTLWLLFFFRGHNVSVYLFFFLIMCNRARSGISIVFEVFFFLDST